MAVPPPTPEQQRAIATRDRHVFLEAGAGTGKTRVLVDRYCEAVCADGVEVDGILAFTFTERAAAELRERVRRSLMEHSRAAREAGDAGRARELAEHARATERAWVSTIHGFCRRLLAAHPLAAGLDPRFRVLDQNEAARLRERAFTEALAALLEQGSEAVARAAAAYRPWRLADAVLAAHERLRSQGMAVPALPVAGEPVRSAKPGAEAEPLTPAEAQAATAAREAFDAVLAAFGERYEALKAERAGLDFADLELRAVELLRGSPALAETWRERYRHVLVDEFQDTNRVQLELIERLVGPQTRLFTVGDENQSIYRFRNADLEVFRERRELARSDPSTELLALRGNFRSLPAVLAAVNAQGGALLEDFPGLSWGRPEPDSGEPAGAAELLLTRAEGSSKHARWDDEGIDLDPPAADSGPSVVAEARFLARRLRELVDAGEAARGEIVLLLRAFTHVDAFTDALSRAGLDPYVVGGRGYWSQQQVEDLVRLLGCVANPLDDEVLFGALASPACGVSPDALWLLRRAAGKGQHIWPLVAWRYVDSEREPFEPDLEWLEHVPDDDAQRLAAFCATLAPLRSEAPLIGLEALVERTMAAFSYDLALLARPGGAGRMANVRKLMRLAREYERHEGRDLRGFLAAAADSARRDEREGMAPVRAEDHDGVRVMTVHAAKGLEFGVVAVADLGRGLSGRSWVDIELGRTPPDGRERRFGMRVVFPDAESVKVWELEELDAEEKAADAEEGCRLAYVAATRAENRLILSGTYREAELEAAEPRPSDSPLRRLLPRLAELGWDGADADVELPAPRRAEGADPAEPQAATLPLAIRANAPSPEQAERLCERLPWRGGSPPAQASGPPPLGSERPRQAPVGHLSYSALAEYERCSYRFYVERLLGVRAGALAPATGEDGAGEDWRERARGVGTAAHAALELAIRDGWDEADEGAVDSILRREGLGEDDEARERVLAGVGAWLGCGLRAELAGRRLRPEVPFVLGVGGTVIRGQIDLLAEGGDGPPVVVDFKTDALDGRSPAEAGDRYAAQREVYALAASADGGAVRAVHLFLESANDPVVQEFCPAELGRARERLTGLIGRARAGEFEPTARPSRSVCFGCPAAARLCPHPKWRPPSVFAADPPASDGEPGATEIAVAGTPEAGAQGTLFE